MTMKDSVVLITSNPSRRRRRRRRCCSTVTAAMFGFVIFGLAFRCSSWSSSSQHDLFRRLQKHTPPKHVTTYQERHPNMYSNNHYYNTGSSYYDYSDDDHRYGPNKKGQYHHSQYYHRRPPPQTNLSDVWLCLLCALGWTVWFVSSWYSTRRQGKQQDQFAQSALLVKGHVLHVSPVVTTGTGIPTYQAVIDYVVEDEKNHENIQIRKIFETQNATLQQGFANVELLVLPAEPTQSILKEDFDQQFHHHHHHPEHQLTNHHQQWKPPACSTHEVEEDETCLPCGDCCGDCLDQEEYCCHHHPAYYCQHVSTMFAAVLVLASLAGTIQVVRFLDEDIQWQGWISLIIGTALLLPVAVALWKCMEWFKHIQEPDEKQGIIVQSFTRDNGTVQSNPHPNPPSSNPTNHHHRNKSSSSTSVASGFFVEEYCGACCGNNTHAAAEVASYIVPEMSGCYFVHYPTKSNNHHQHHGGKKRRGKSSQTTNSNNNNVNNSILEQPPPSPQQKEQRRGTQPNLESPHNEHSSSSASTVSSLSSRDHSGIHEDSSSNEEGRINVTNALV